MRSRAKAGREELQLHPAGALQIRSNASELILLGLSHSHTYQSLTEFTLGRSKLPDTSRGGIGILGPDNFLLLLLGLSCVF